MEHLYIYSSTYGLEGGGGDWDLSQCYIDSPEKPSSLYSIKDYRDNIIAKSFSSGQSLLEYKQTTITTNNTMVKIPHKIR